MSPTATAVREMYVHMALRLGSVKHTVCYQPHGGRNAKGDVALTVHQGVPVFKKVCFHRDVGSGLAVPIFVEEVPRLARVCMVLHALRFPHCNRTPQRPPAPAGAAARKGFRISRDQSNAGVSALLKTLHVARSRRCPPCPSYLNKCAILPLNSAMAELAPLPCHWQPVRPQWWVRPSVLRSRSSRAIITCRWRR